MSMTHLGPSIDIHTGGVDLIFPHHEDEIAQSEAATGVEFVRTWLHCAHLQFAGAKMAKSTGNTARVADLLEQGVSARALRYALISVHYRAPLAYSEESLAAASAAVDRLDAVLAALGTYHQDGSDDPTLSELIDETRAAFRAALDDDLNVSPALGALFEYVREVNRRLNARTLSTADAGRAAELIRELDTVLGVTAETASEVPTDIAELIEARAAARAARDWAESDRLRDELADRGFAIEDTRDGQRWRRLADVTSG
jgi:cysteinyl-tRNA synthetase